MTDKYTTLEAAAKAATPGEWTFNTDGSCAEVGSASQNGIICCVWLNYRETKDRDIANLSYVAAANPSVILGLISELRALRGLVDELAFLLHRATDHDDGWQHAFNARATKAIQEYETMKEGGE